MRTIVCVVIACLSLSALGSDMAQKIAAFTGPAWLGIGGDSIPAGGGEADRQIGSVLRTVTTNLITYTNYAVGGYYWSNVLSGQITNILKSTPAPAAVFIHCGINDLYYERTWEDVRADMNVIKSACDASNAVLIIDLLFPYSPFNATQNVALRTWNTNYVNWSATNGSKVLSSHDYMGTGSPLFDTLNASYDNGDGIHPNATGATAWGNLIMTNLFSWFNDPVPVFTFGTLRVENLRQL